MDGASLLARQLLSRSAVYRASVWLVVAMGCATPVSIELEADKSEGDWTEAMSPAEAFLIGTQISAQNPCRSRTSCEPRLELSAQSAIVWAGVYQPTSQDQGTFVAAAPVPTTVGQLRALSYLIWDDATQSMLAQGTLTPSSSEPGRLDAEQAGLMIRTYSVRTLPVELSAECAIGRIHVWRGLEHVHYAHLGLGESYADELRIGDRIETWDGESYFVGPYTREIPLTTQAECEWDVQVLAAHNLPTTDEMGHSWEAWGDDADPVVELALAEPLRHEWATTLGTTPQSGSGYNITWPQGATVGSDLRGSNLYRLSFKIWEHDRVVPSAKMDLCQHVVDPGDFDGEPIDIHCSERGSTLRIRFVPSAAPGR